MIHTTTTDLIANHRTIRSFKDQTLSPEQLETLYTAASHTSTSMFLQQFSILHVTDPAKWAAIRAISGQQYIGANGDLFVYIVDLHRNQQIRQQLGFDDGRLHTFDVFMQGVEDTVLALQNTVTAAESMGLGAVILGSVNDDPEQLVKVLNLPALTFPILGLQVGVPNQEPQLKPRLPINQIAFENEYPRDFDVRSLADYDKIVQTYYDLRNANRRIDSFTKQITGSKLTKQTIERDKLAGLLKHQGLALDWQ